MAAVPKIHWIITGAFTGFERDEVYSRNSCSKPLQMKPAITKIRGEWLILMAAVLWGTTGTSQALAPAGAAPIAVGFMRLAVGGAALLAVSMLRGSLVGGRPWSVRTVLLAAACVAGYQICFFSGVARTGVAIGTLVGIGSSPVIAGLLDWLVEGLRPGRRWAVATCLAILGCALLAFSGEQAVFEIWGITLAMIAGAFYAVYSLLSKRMLKDHPSEAVMAFIVILGALILSPVVLFVDLSWLRQPRGLAAALHLGLMATALAYTLFGRGLKTVQAASAVTITLAEPLTAGLLGVFLLGERLTPIGWVGIAFLFGGLALISFRQNK